MFRWLPGERRLVPVDLTVRKARAGVEIECRGAASKVLLRSLTSALDDVLPTTVTRCFDRGIVPAQAQYFITLRWRAPPGEALASPPSTSTAADGNSAGSEGVRVRVCEVPPGREGVRVRVRVCVVSSAPAQKSGRHELHARGPRSEPGTWPAY